MSDKTSGGTFPLLKSLKFIFISYFVALILIAVLSSVITYTDISENIMAPSVRVITFFQAFLCALLVTRCTGTRGWLTGALTGAVNIAVLIILGMAIYADMSFSSSNALTILYGTLSGMAGGIIGVNIKA